MHKGALPTKWKGSSWNWGKIFTNYIYDKGLISRIYKKPQLNKKLTTWFKKTWIDISLKKKHKYPINIWRDVQHHASLGICKSKLQWDITSLGWFLRKKIQNNKCWQGYGEIETLTHCSWDIKWYSRCGKQYSSSLKN